MKPQRLAALNNLVVHYELDKKMEMRLSPRANAMDMRFFTYVNRYTLALELRTTKHCSLIHIGVELYELIGLL